MSRIWAITTVCLLSCCSLIFVDASGTAAVKVQYFLLSTRKIMSMFGEGFVCNITLKQPNITETMHESVPIRSRDKAIIFRFKRWTGTLNCRITVDWGKILSIYLRKTMFNKIIEFPEKSIHFDVSRFAIITFRKRFRPDHPLYEFQMRVEVECDRFYFGADCSRHCRAQDGPRGHYDCTAAGHKRCRPNWRRAASNCTEPDPCRPSRCRNGAVCAETPGASFACRCPRAFRGRLCEVPRSPCELAGPCRNGGLCVNVNGGAVCRCPGPRCKTDAPDDDDGHTVPATRGSVIVSAALLSAAASAVVVLVVVGLLHWRTAARRAVCRPPRPLRVGWRPSSDEGVSSLATTATLAP